MKLSCAHDVHIVYHPARYHSIEHHKQIVAGIGIPAEFVPVAALRCKLLERRANALATSSAYRKLTGKDRISQKQQTQQIYHDKYRSTILPAYIRELPYISKTYSTSRRNKDEPKSGGKLFSVAVVIIFTHTLLFADVCKNDTCLLLFYITRIIGLTLCVDFQNLIHPLSVSSIYFKPLHYVFFPSLLTHTL